MEVPDLSNGDLSALVDWYNQHAHVWLAVAADKNARWPIPDSLKALLPVVSGEDTITVGAQKVTDALYMSRVAPGAVVAEMGLLLLQVKL